MVTEDLHRIRAMVRIWYANTGMEIDSRFMLHVLINEKPDISYLIGEVYRERLARA